MVSVMRRRQSMFQSQIQELEETLAERDDEIERLQGRTRELEENGAALEDRNGQLEESRQDWEDKARAWEDKCHEWEGKSHQWEKNSNEWERKSGDFQAKWQNTEAKWHAAEERAHSLEEKLHEAEDERDSLRRKLGEKDGQFSEERKQRVACEDRLEEAQSQLQEKTLQIQSLEGKLLRATEAGSQHQRTHEEDMQRMHETHDKQAQEIQKGREACTKLSIEVQNLAVRMRETEEKHVAEIRRLEGLLDQAHQDLEKERHSNTALISSQEELRQSMWDEKRKDTEEKQTLKAQLTMKAEEDKESVKQQMEAKLNTTVDEFQQERMRLNDQITQLRNDLAMERQRCISLDEARETLERDLSGERRRGASLDELVANLRSTLDQLTREKQDIEASVVASHQKLNTTEAQFKDAQRRHSLELERIHQQQAQTLRSSADDNHKRLTQMGQEHATQIDDLRSHHAADLKKVLEEYEVAVQNVRLESDRQMSAVQKQHSKEIDEITAAHHSALQDMRNEMSRLQNELYDERQRHQLRLEAEALEYRRKDEETNELIGKLKHMETKILPDMKKKLEETGIEAMSVRQQLESARRDAEEHRLAAIASKEQLTDHLKKADFQLTELQGELSRAKSENVSLQAQLETLRSYVKTRAEAQSPTVLQKSIDDRKEVQAAERAAELQRARDENVQLRRRIEDLETHNERLRYVVDANQQNLDKITSPKLGDRDTVGQTGEVARLAALLSRKEKQVADMLSEKSRIQCQLVEKTAECERLRRQLEAQQHSLSTMELHEKNVECQQLRNQVDSLKEEVERLHGDRMRLMDISNQLRAELKRVLRAQEEMGTSAATQPQAPLPGVSSPGFVMPPPAYQPSSYPPYPYSPPHTSNKLQQKIEEFQKSLSALQETIDVAPISRSKRTGARMYPTVGTEEDDADASPLPRSKANGRKGRRAIDVALPPTQTPSPARRLTGAAASGPSSSSRAKSAGRTRPRGPSDYTVPGGRPF